MSDNKTSDFDRLFEAIGNGSVRTADADQMRPNTPSFREELLRHADNPLFEDLFNFFHGEQSASKLKIKWDARIKVCERGIATDTTTHLIVIAMSLWYNVNYLSIYMTALKACIGNDLENDVAYDVKSLFIHDKNTRLGKISCEMRREGMEPKVGTIEYSLVSE